VKLAYQAFDRAGRQVADTIEASGADEASDVLRRRGLYVTEIRAGSEAGLGSTGTGRARPSGGKGRLKSLALMASQLHVLVSCGTPLVEALGALARQIRDRRLRSIVQDVQRRVEEGAPLSAALERYPGYFGPVFRSLVQAGEASGDLAGMLERMATTLRKRLRTRNTVIGASVYPLILTGVGVAVLSLMFTVVIPRFGDLFKTLGVPLPPTTAVLVTISNALLGYWYVVVPAVLALLVGGMAFTLSSPGRRLVQTLVLHAPPFGRIVRSFATARIVRLLGTLLDANVPILEALALCRRSVSNHHYDRLLAQTEDAVTQGETLSAVWTQSPLISPSVQEVVRNGERTGQVASMLLSAADFLDDENELTVRNLTSLLEPIILILMGLVVGLVAVSMFLPLFDLTAMTQG